MGLFQLIYDTTNKKTLLQASGSLTPYPGFTDYIETVTGSAKTTFTLAVDIDSGHAIDVDIDGRNQPIEGTHWTRTNGSPGEIVMAEAIPVGKIFKARVYTK